MLVARPRTRRVGCHPPYHMPAGWLGTVPPGTPGCSYLKKEALEAGQRTPQGEPRGVGAALGPQETQPWRAVTGHGAQRLECKAAG